MTLTDVRRTILESSDPKWFNEVTETFNFDYVNENVTITGISSIYEFTLKQIDGWEKLGSNLPSELQHSKSYFGYVKSNIISFLVNYSKLPSNSLVANWNGIKNIINNPRGHSNYPLKFNSVEVEFLLKTFNDYPKSFASAFNFIIGSNNYNLNNKDALIGVVLAYEFTVKDASKIVRRSNAEKSSFKTLKNELERYFSEAESNLVEHLNIINNKNAEYLQSIDSLKSEKEKSFNEWYGKAQGDFNTFNSTSKKDIDSLHKAYDELLMLKKPADYWRSRAIELKAEGKKFLNWLIALIVFTCAILYSLLWLTPETMLTSFFNGDKTLAIRFTIIFITLISFLAFGIKALTKVTFSSFHLARDAEEREKLTYVYLAMVKDASVDKNDRQLIMQSLFSRADTGLLKEDSSPTMPGSLIERAVR
jgi:hypothetical protein